MIPFYAAFSLIFVLASVEEHIKPRKELFIFLALLLVLFAGLRSSGVDLDYEGYQNWFDEVFSLGEYVADPVALFQRDPSYQLISSVFKSIGLPFVTLVLAMACVTVVLKMRMIWRLSPAPLFSVFFYFSYLYLLQEMTQIRAGLAAAIFLYAIPWLAQRRHVVYVGLILLAASFHYSALILLIFLPLKETSGNGRGYLIVLIGSVVLALLGWTIDSAFLKIAELGVDSRLSFYAAASVDSLGTTNLFNSISIPNLFLSLMLLLNFEKVRDAAPYASFMVRIHAISVIMFFLLSGYPVMAFRLSEMIGVVGIVAWPLLIPIFRSPWWRNTFFLLIGLNYLISTLRLMQDYSMLGLN
ncbi:MULTISPECIES: EpsG family protein [Cupriavidus]